MLYNQLLEYCYFYKGEVICPEEFDRKNEGKLQFVEKMTIYKTTNFNKNILF